MMRQAGTLANRLLTGYVQNQNQCLSGPGKLLWNASFNLTNGVATEAVGSKVDVTGMSSMAVEALKAKHVAAGSSGFNPSKTVVTGPLRLKAVKPAGGLPFGMGGAAVRAVSTEAAAQPKPKSSLLRKLMAPIAALAAALGLAASTVSADAPENWQMTFQDPATANAQAIIDLHHDIAFFLITILVVVLYMFYQILTKFHYTKQPIPERLTHHNTLELIWSVIPTVIVAMIAVPSLTLIYSWDEHTERPGLTVKVIGRQWYWSYEMHDHLQHKLADPDRLLSIAEKGLDK